ncbi:MAG TPA: hypothetical protein VMN77_12565 [Nitrospiria bacterium]|jgi:F0F1-type ATP synthase assembly protein I|nr:hypothetical protein [Nitrospiria bacterium]
MGSPTAILMVGLVVGYLVIERIFVTSPKFLPFYIIGSAIIVMMTIRAF